MSSPASYSQNLGGAYGGSVWSRSTFERVFGRAESRHERGYVRPRSEGFWYGGSEAGKYGGVSMDSMDEGDVDMDDGYEEVRGPSEGGRNCEMSREWRVPFYATRCTTFSASVSNVANALFATRFSFCRTETGMRGIGRIMQVRAGDIVRLSPPTLVLISNDHEYHTPMRPRYASPQIPTTGGQD